MNETHRRPWWRLHIVTLLVGTLAVASFFVLNYYERRGNSDRTWDAGWPMQHFTRDERYKDSLVPDLGIMTMTGPVADQQAILQAAQNNGVTTHPDLFRVNLLLSVVIIAAAIYFVERRVRQLPDTSRFGIASLLATMATIATFVAIWRAWDRPWEVIRSDIAFGIAAASVIFAWLGAFDLISVLWNRLGRRIQSSDATDSEPASPNKR